MSALERVAGQPTWLLGRANARAHALLTDAFRAHGLRGHHFRLLAALDQYGASSQADLGRSTGIDRSDVVARLDDLVAAGLASRDPDPRDRRRNLVTLTPRGVAMLGTLQSVLDQVQDDVLSPLTPAERKTFVRLLGKLT
ncbi:MarR family winged helix-turn-helix transcriptional regulator [Mumia quercus]|uniref:MarR family winged helix-turn-helix transcriptional regulator n=1 Tax=Mumia quercus TaxID=2976125 RepID=UPI0021D119AF|nr:MarR family winged helix-turn-helix transcriptional regulator [Mumia quercus]